MKVTIFNDTPYAFIVRDGIFLKRPDKFTDKFHHSYSSTIGRIYPLNQKGSSYTYEFFKDTVKDCNLFLLKAVGSSEVALIIPAEDNEQASEIRVYETPGNNEIQHWISKPRRSSDELWKPITPAIKDLVSFEAVKGDVSTRMETVERYCMNLEKALKQVKICHAQCDHLVRTYSTGIQKMVGTYCLVSKGFSRMWSLYESKKLRLLSSSLDSLIHSLMATEDLLQACGEKELKRIALVVSMPPPTVRTYSKFDVLIRELSWALDVILYASSLEYSEFRWSEARCRYVLRRNQETDIISDAEVESVAPVGGDDRLVYDRRNLLSHLAAETLNLPDVFAAVLKERLLQEIPSLQNPGLVIPECFQINRSDLHLGRCISKGSFKKIYQGKWFGQPVAIAKIKGSTKNAIEREAGFMVEVQHPNIVDFFGSALVEKRKEADLEDNTEENINLELIGYLVMELMQEDLRSLIDREVKCHSGAPFSFSVSVDILLQIVEAMIHLHKHHVIYRDLKAKNCLVSPRPKSSPQNGLDVYTVKLIDFGTSKILDSENDETDTVDVGTRRWMAPEVWAMKPNKRAAKSLCECVHSFGTTYSTATTSLFPFRFVPSRKQPVAKERKRPEKLYSRSADVYSFAMTCYEITTGLLPFHDVENRDIPTMIFREKRPSFSHPAANTCPLRLQKLITECWAQKPRDRPQFEDIRRELWSIKYDIEVQR